MEAQQDQDCRKNQQECVLLHDIGSIEDLPYKQPKCHGGPRSHVDQAEPAKEVQRPRHVAKEKPNGEEIEHDPEGARQVVMRYPVLPMLVLNRNFTDRGAVCRSQSWYKSVHLSIERQLRKEFAAVCLKCCSEIVNVDAAELGHEPVCTT